MEKLKCGDVCNRCTTGFVNCDMKCEECVRAVRHDCMGSEMYHCKCIDIKVNTPCPYFSDDSEKNV